MEFSPNAKTNNNIHPIGENMHLPNHPSVYTNEHWCAHMQTHTKYLLSLSITTKTTSHVAISSLCPQKILLTSSAADFGHSDRLKGKGDSAGACAQGIWNSFTTRWLITASTPAKSSIPCGLKRMRRNEIQTLKHKNPTLIQS